MTEIGEIIRPVRNDHRIGVIRQILSDMPGILFATQLKVHAGRNEPKIRNDVLLHPWMNLGGKWQRNIEVLITIFGDECQTDKTPTKAMELGIKEIRTRERRVVKEGVSMCRPKESHDH